MFKVNPIKIMNAKDRFVSRHKGVTTFCDKAFDKISVGSTIEAKVTDAEGHAVTYRITVTDEDMKDMREFTKKK